MRKLCISIVGGVCDSMATISDFFEDNECYRLSRAFHRIYNGLDNVRWALWPKSNS